MKRKLLATWMMSCAWASSEVPAKKAASAPTVKTKISQAQGKAEIVPAAAESAVAKPMAVDASIPESVRSLGEPTRIDFPGGIQMAITTPSDKAQMHVNQGMNLVLSGWEFEASRHFAVALREDPDCLLANWGMLMSLLTPSPETDSARVAVTARLLDLVDLGVGTELERGYVYGLIKYIEQGPAAAGSAFRKVADTFPNDLQAGIYAALFSRSGFDELGAATPGQAAAEASLSSMIEKNPQSSVLLYALLSIRAEAPDLSGSVELARKLCQMVPDYAPYFHLLGHYEWRTGQHGKAVAALGRASSIFQRWMKENQASVADCPDWVKSECYRAVAIASKGDFDTAFAAARQIAVTPLPSKRESSAGARLLMWDAKTLPARILLQRGLRGYAKTALDSLPKSSDVKNTRTQSLAYWWIDGLRIALEAQRLIDEGMLGEAKDAVAAVAFHGEQMSKTQALAKSNGERSEWARSFRAIEMLTSELRGNLTLAGPKDRSGTAFNWYSAAIDRQQPASMMVPPLILTPLAIRLGNFYLLQNQVPEAVESYQKALVAFPNDMLALQGLKKAYEQAKQTTKSAEIEKTIQALKAQ